MPEEKASSSGAFLPASLMYFCSGQPMHFCCGVDTRASIVQRGPFCIFSTVARVFYEARKDMALMRFAPTKRMGD